MRPPRQEAAGAITHVWTRGNDKGDIYLSEDDRRLWLVTLACVIEDTGWECLAYVQMTNHYHLVVRTPRANLGVGMRMLNGMYARAFNDRHGRRDHLFGRRYGHKRIEDDGHHLWWAAAYVALNPVRAGLCDAPEDWRWSGYSATIGLAEPPRWLQVARLFAGTRLGPDAFAEYVRDVPRETAVGPALRALAG